jgi:hypothetical protein
MPEETIPIREYFEKQFEAHEKLNDAKFESVEKAVTVANTNMEHRLAGLNEWRATITDFINASITRKEFEGAHATVLEDIKRLDISRAMLEGKASQKSVNMAFLISAVGIILSIISIVLRLKG